MPDSFPEILLSLNKASESPSEKLLGTRSHFGAFPLLHESPFVLNPL